MTLYELANDVTIQGAVRLSAWYGDDEKVLSETPATDDFNIYDLDEKWEDAEVLYMFCSGDGFLHIEVEAVEDD